MKKFWQLVSKKDIIFIVILFAAVIFIANIESANMVKVYFGEEILAINSSKYNMNISYTDVESITLAENPALGEPVDGKNNASLRYGVWKNDAWGEYHLCMDPGATNCIVVQLKDGRYFVFNRKDNETTAGIYEQFQTYLNN